jgi:hypothetical protein
MSLINNYKQSLNDPKITYNQKETDKRLDKAFQSY